MTLPAEPHPIVNAFTHLLKDGENTAEKSKKSSTIHKVSQVLGWRNRFSQSEYYPIELCLSNPHGINGLPHQENSTIGFKVKPDTWRGSGNGLRMVTPRHKTFYTRL